jgi:hypothetical protein
MIEIIKKNLAALMQGIMFGLGFCIAAWSLYFVFHPRQETAASHFDSSPELPTSAQHNSFSFRNVEEIKRNGHSYFIGTVKNTGSIAARGISIEVNLFSRDKFVDQYSSYITGELAAGEERYFKVSCGCKDEPPTEHDSYKVEVVGGY